MDAQEAEDRVASLIFGEEPEQEQAEETQVEEQEESEVEAAEEETQEESEEQPEYVELELDGKVWDVPKELEPYILRQQDYTKKTQEASTIRKAVEAEQALVKQERDRYEFINSVQNEVAQLQQFEAAIPQWEEYLSQNVKELDTKQIAEIQLQIRQLEKQRDAKKQELQVKYGEFQQAQEQSKKELLNKSTEVLRSKFSDWSGEKVVDYAKSLGFTEDQVAIAQLDPKQMELVRKAMLYDQLQETKGAAVAKVKSAPQIKAKSRNPMPKETQDKLNLRKKIKNPNLTAAQKAELIGSDIAGRMFRG